MALTLGFEARAKPVGGECSHHCATHQAMIPKNGKNVDTKLKIRNDS